ncbi:VOC family protein [Nocardia sp. N2S4-5]|uniref:VOC family protein n=1 Tax=Nocardia sp. N2S4-5 TaxID=3351565 RepID=UPI0037D397F6
MITGAHTIIHATDPDRARAFFRDVLGLPNVDAGNGWLIFRSPPAELAVHPAAESDSGRLDLYLMCDDLTATVAELTAKGVEFTGDTTEAGWGTVTALRVPGAGEIGLYQPHHPIAHGLD